ncbi:hypothetical protein CN115_27170 [Sinorhizobium meliloti]|nr:hypothetical protein DA101_003360 [Sinorhizobium meliloti]RVN05481.1 hypothetical protein CN115_27170 [Sinorhizobium meliloti]RVN17898.1 hypothetical protein CN114_26750 [Sinorhizobium meliloti]RVN41202.1 hypothetical protein CN111_16400 [Sinorhizobium meliloti]RVO01146.1 hypothetical protein CN099_29755 [Sinorhizobium meliloti]
MQDRDEYGLPGQNASLDGTTRSDTPKIAVAERRKLVGVHREPDPRRLKGLEYLGRRLLSHR